MPTYSQTRTALTLVNQHLSKSNAKIVCEFINDAVEEVDALEEEVKDLRKKAGCEMCVGDDGSAFYGKVGKYYYGEGVTADCFCVEANKMKENPFHHIKHIVEIEIENDDPVLSVLCETLKDVLAKMEKRDKELKKKSPLDYLVKKQNAAAERVSAP
jgi:hypothetical protein